MLNKKAIVVVFFLHVEMKILGCSFLHIQSKQEFGNSKSMSIDKLFFLLFDTIQNYLGGKSQIKPWLSDFLSLQ